MGLSTQSSCTVNVAAWLWLPRDGGRWSQDVVDFTVGLAAALAHEQTPLLRRSAFLAWRRRLLGTQHHTTSLVWTGVDLISLLMRSLVR